MVKIFTQRMQLKQLVLFCIFVALTVSADNPDGGCGKNTPPDMSTNATPPPKLQDLTPPTLVNKDENPASPAPQSSDSKPSSTPLSSPSSLSPSLPSNLPPGTAAPNQSTAAIEDVDSEWKALTTCDAKWTCSPSLFAFYPQEYGPEADVAKCKQDVRANNPSWTEEEIASRGGCFQYPHPQFSGVYTNCIKWAWDGIIHQQELYEKYAKIFYESPESTNIINNACLKIMDPVTFANGGMSYCIETVYPDVKFFTAPNGGTVVCESNGGGKVKLFCAMAECPDDCGKIVTILKNILSLYADLDALSNRIKQIDLASNIFAAKNVGPSEDSAELITVDYAKNHKIRDYFNELSVFSIDMDAQINYIAPYHPVCDQIRIYLHDLILLEDEVTFASTQNLDFMVGRYSNLANVDMAWYNWWTYKYSDKPYVKYAIENLLNGVKANKEDFEKCISLMGENHISKSISEIVSSLSKKAELDLRDLILTLERKFAAVTALRKLLKTILDNKLILSAMKENTFFSSNLMEYYKNLIAISKNLLPLEDELIFNAVSLFDFAGLSTEQKEYSSKMLKSLFIGQGYTNKDRELIIELLNISVKQKKLNKRLIFEYKKLSSLVWN